MRLVQNEDETDRNAGQVKTLAMSSLALSEVWESKTMLAKMPPWVVFPLIFFALVIGLFYVFDACLSGIRVAARRLPSFAVVFVGTMLALLVLLGSIPASWRGRVSSVISLACAGCLWAYFLTYIGQEPRAGRVLLDIGRSGSHAAGGIVACLALGLLIREIFEADLGLERIYRIVALLSLGMLNLFIGLSRLKITEQGIFWARRLIKWEEIKTYKWEKGRRCLLTLNLFRRLPLFDEVNIPIPPSHKDAVDNLLRENVSDST